MFITRAGDFFYISGSDGEWLNGSAYLVDCDRWIEKASTLLKNYYIMVNEC